MRRIEYAGSVHDDEEIEAVVSVLRGGATALRIGPHVRAFEQGVAGLFGKRHGVMVNSGSSALYLAVELLGLAPGDEILTSPLTFSTDIAPMVRSGLVPVFVDVEADTYNLDVAGLEAVIGPRTKAILAPNLIGNAPDWDVIRAVADEHGLLVVEDSCDALGSTLRGTPTGLRSDLSVTSFALSHIITAAGTGGMVCLDDDEWWDRALVLRRWGRRSEVAIHGTGRGRARERRFFSEIDGDLVYDDLFIFDEVGWNFEPSELSAAFGEVQLRKLPQNLAARKRNFARLCEGFGQWPEQVELPRTLDGLDTAWHLFPLLLRAGLDRSAFQQHMESNGIDTRMVWTGNVLRQPGFKGIEHRAPPGGLPNADRVMERGVVLPSNHGLDDADVDHIVETAAAFLAEPVR